MQKLTYLIISILHVSAGIADNPADEPSAIPKLSSQGQRMDWPSHACADTPGEQG